MLQRCTKRDNDSFEDIGHNNLLFILAKQLTLKDDNSGEAVIVYPKDNLLASKRCAVHPSHSSRPHNPDRR